MDPISGVSEVSGAGPASDDERKNLLFRIASAVLRARDAAVEFEDDSELEQIQTALAMDASMQSMQPTAATRHDSTSTMTRDNQQQEMMHTSNQFVPAMDDTHPFHIPPVWCDALSGGG